ncbi:FAD/NAD(P)-binding domain-containing protein [Exidia glandulosa HHB12029]|uniref:FAD/NAD(P)-binding domain-containing protein n=1 Tax=Exidia glandulosa HHB12029 TaxID=1314781 RepID=A0A166BGS5_EXIGL|nr:FAD/NAD(P)-binding domain-containing protein [Exidia glandulosa HHB12029]
MPLRVAVVGSGCAGLAATWLLNEHSDNEVHLYEADNRPGGHANTVEFTPPKSSGLTESVFVDTGFIVCNPSTYPNFLRFLDLKGIDVVPTDMTFSISRDRGAYEWAGTPNPATVFCQPRNLLNPKTWGMIWDVLRFNACALEVLDPLSPDTDLSIGDYLEKHQYSAAFRDDYLIPVTSAIWSAPPDKCSLGFPARTLVQFMANHHLLQLLGKPSWLTIPGGSHKYVKQIVGRLSPQNVHMSTPIQSLNTSEVPGSVVLVTADGQRQVYDHVILACHSDTALRILESGGDVTEKEREILGMFSWNRNEAVLHSDVELMPKSRMAWACWNYLTSSSKAPDGSLKANVDQVALTYGMNDLQHIDEDKHGPVLVTLNPPFEPDPAKVVGRWSYDHPVLDAGATRAQALLPSIQNTRGISYVGAWTRYGFHEDGFTSGMRAAEAFCGAKPPFDIRSADRAHVPNVPLARFFAFVQVSGIRAVVGMILSVLLQFLASVFLRS